MRTGMQELGRAFYPPGPFFWIAFHFFIYILAHATFTLSVILLLLSSLASILKFSYKPGLETATRKRSHGSMSANTNSYTWAQRWISFMHTHSSIACSLYSNWWGMSKSRTDCVEKGLSHEGSAAGCTSQIQDRTEIAPCKPPQRQWLTHPWAQALAPPGPGLCSVLYWGAVTPSTPSILPCSVELFSTCHRPWRISMSLMVTLLVYKFP